jgi:putative transposase
MPSYHIPLFPGGVYHLFNRAVGEEKLFREEDNYRYFLTKMTYHILPVADIFTYSLIPNHFHLLARIKPEDEIIAHYRIKKKKDPPETDNVIPDFIMERFSNWLNGYAKAFNKMYDRKGALFIDYLKRRCVEDDADLSSIIFYIHKNAVHHGLKKKIGDWKYDGYQAMLCDQPTFLLRNEVLNWFGNKDLFTQFHNQPVVVKPIRS